MNKEERDLLDRREDYVSPYYLLIDKRWELIITWLWWQFEEKSDKKLELYPPHGNVVDKDGVWVYYKAKGEDDWLPTTSKFFIDNATFNKFLDWEENYLSFINRDKEVRYSLDEDRGELRNNTYIAKDEESDFWNYLYNRGYGEL